MKYLLIYLSWLMTFSVYAEGLPRVEIETNMGNIVLELYPEKAPRTVKNFIQYAQEGFYENTIFHRVIPKFMIQGGGYTSQFEKKLTRDSIVNEANNGLKNLHGSVAIARHTNDPDSAAAQFFINGADNPSLDYVSTLTPKSWGYTVFGKVIEGMDVVEKIETVKTGKGGEFSKNVPIKPVIIQKVVVSNIPQNLDELEANAIATPKTPAISAVGMTGTAVKNTTEDNDEDVDEDVTDDAADDEEDDEETDDEDLTDDEEMDDADEDANDEDTETVDENEGLDNQVIKNKSPKVTTSKDNKPQPAPDAPSKPDTPEPLSE